MGMDTAPDPIKPAAQQFTKDQIDRAKMEASFSMGSEEKVPLSKAVRDDMGRIISNAAVGTYDFVKGGIEAGGEALAPTFEEKLEHQRRDQVRSGQAVYKATAALKREKKSGGTKTKIKELQSKLDDLMAKDKKRFGTK